MEQPIEPQEEVVVDDWTPMWVEVSRVFVVTYREYPVPERTLVLVTEEGEEIPVLALGPVSTGEE